MQKKRQAKVLVELKPKNLIATWYKRELVCVRETWTDMKYKRLVIAHRSLGSFPEQRLVTVPTL